MINLPDEEIETRAFIGGQYHATVGGFIEKISPADGRKIPNLYAASVDDVNKAVICANNALEQGIWRNKSFKDRKLSLLKWADLIERDKKYLSYLDALETGRSYQNFLNDSLPKAIEALRWFAEACDKLQEKLISPDINKICLVQREPLGVVGIITPWNDPLVSALWKTAPALGVGNSVVLKPAEQSSYSILRIAAMSVEAGIPPGVFNVIPGIGEIAGEALVGNNKIRGIFFTGSSEVGKKIISTVGKSSIKKIGLECGGKSAFIVTGNCLDIESAAKILAKNIFYNQGQICSAPSRLIVHQSKQKEFISFLSEEMKKYLPTNPLSVDCLVGGISSEDQYKKIMAYINAGEKLGYEKLTCPGFKPPHKDGFYISPTIFLNVPPESQLFSEEIFGPVLVTTSYNNVDEAIKLANATEFGLAAGVFSDLIDEALYISRSLNAGIVHVNSYGEDDISIPFGGTKQSGMGVDKSLMAFDEYSINKSTWISLKNIAAPRYG